MSAFGNAYDPVDRIVASHARVCAEELDQLRWLAEVDRDGSWDAGEFHGIEAWLSALLHLTWTEAKRRVESARVIDDFPLIAAALGRGALTVDQAVELTRFATVEKQQELIDWARSVSLRYVREVANASQSPDVQEVRNNDRCRNFGWSYKDGGTRVAFFGGMPVEQGRVVINAIEAARSPGVARTVGSTSTTLSSPSTAARRGPGTS